VAIKILIADDHKIMRDGLSSLLKKQPDMEVVGEAENGRTAVREAIALSPDVVIMDASMPELNGIDATHQILSHRPDTKILALSMYYDKQYVTNMLKAGASGYLIKDCAFDQLIQAIRTVVANHMYLSPKITAIVVGDYLNQVSQISKPQSSSLLPRERELLQLIAEGKTTKEIAERFFVSVKTIETHRRKIMKKLEVESVAELTKIAVQQGLTSIEK